VGNFRFYRRLHLFPGLSVNVSKSGPSLTVGMRGAHLTFGPRGVTRTLGIPGTGIYYTSRTGRHSGFHTAHLETPVTVRLQAMADRLITVALLVIGALFAIGIGLAIGSLMSH
jgi:hypothetical protein